MPNLVSLTHSSLQILGKAGPDRVKLDKRNKTMSEKLRDDVISANCDVIVILLIYGQFGEFWKPDYGRIVCKTYIFIKSNLLS